MMRLTVKLCLAALLALGFAGCSDDDKGGGGPKCKKECKEDYYCAFKDDGKTEQCVPYCKETCGVDEQCNHDKKACEPAICKGKTCEKGQGCYDYVGETFEKGSPETYACTCIPRMTVDDVDSCADYGLVCGYEDNNQPAKCVKPGLFAACQAEVGCADDTLECVNVPGLTVPNLCLSKTKCTSNADCENLDNCIVKTDQGIGAIKELVGQCDSSLYCGFSVNSQATAQATLWQKCDVVRGSGLKDGTCILTLGRSQYFETHCIAGGSLSTGKCDPDANSSDLTKLCPAGQICADIGKDSQGKAYGECRTACNAGTLAESQLIYGANNAGKCASGQRCVVDNTGRYSAPSMNAADLSVGYCWDACTIDGAGCANTPGGQATGCKLLGQAQAQQKPELLPNGACVPVASPAGGLGDECTVVAPPNPDPCGSSLGCNAEKYDETAECVRYCNPENCKTGACAECAAKTCVADATCTPNCTNKECGDNGCGGLCGTALTAAEYCKDGKKVAKSCTPIATPAGAECGDDGCGGLFGVCAAGKYCDSSNKCIDKVVATPVADCAGKECGYDGVGGLCGDALESGEHCDSENKVATTGDCTPETKPEGAECGYDGCGGVFDTCDAGEYCTSELKCAAVVAESSPEADCGTGATAMECGYDGVGGLCGTALTAGQYCKDGKKVEKSCTPTCTASIGCGLPDGCGGYCGEICGSGESCKDGFADYTCKALVDPQNGSKLYLGACQKP